MKQARRAVSPKQLDVLSRAGYTKDELEGLTMDAASKLLDGLDKSGRNWKRPKLEIIPASTQAMVDRSIPQMDSIDWEKFDEGMDEDELELAKSLREDLQDTITKTKKELGLLLTAMKKLYGKYGRWLPLLTALGITEHTAQRWMKVARIVEVPPELESALADEGVKINTHMTHDDERIVTIAADEYNMSNLRSIPGMDGRNKYHEPATKELRAAKAAKIAIDRVAPAPVKSDPGSDCPQPVENKQQANPFDGWVNQVRSSLAQDLRYVPNNRRYDVLVAAFKHIVADLHLEVSSVAAA